MLLELHVKNLALIERVDVELGEGLNILTGETGAGKSILIGSVNLALGQKAPKDIIRNGAEYAYVELVFSVSQEKQKELEALDVFPDDNGLLIITRKIMPTRSVSKINDETVTAAKLRQVTGLLIDIHGQHEHQSLLHASKHLEILDTFAKSRTRLLKDQVVDAYRQYKALKAELEETAIDLEGRGREMDFLRFEIDEIEAAQLKDGEKEILTEQYRRQANGRKILESLSLAYQAVEMDGIGQALRQVNEVAAYDSQLKGILDQLYDAESILNDIRHAIGVYQEEMAFDEEELLQAEQRLDLIHHMESKYGGTTEQVYKTLEEKKQRLEQLEHYDEYRGKQEERYKQASKRLEELSGKLSKERQKAAADLTRAHGFEFSGCVFFHGVPAPGPLHGARV